MTQYSFALSSTMTTASIALALSIPESAVTLVIANGNPTVTIDSGITLTIAQEIILKNFIAVNFYGSNIYWVNMNKT